MESKILCTFCWALLLFLAFSTSKEVFFNNTQNKVKISEDLKDYMNSAMELLQESSALEVRESFGKILQRFRKMSLELCEDWKKSPFRNFEGCNELALCQIPEKIKNILKQIELDANINSIIDVFGPKLSKRSHKIVEKIIHTHFGEPAPILEDLIFKSKPEVSDELAGNVEFVMNGLIQSEKQFHSCLLDANQLARKESPVKTLSDISSYIGLKSSHAVLKRLIVVLSFHFSVEKTRSDVDFDEEAAEFRNHLKQLQDTFRNVSNLWNEKREEFKSKFAVCAPDSVLPVNTEMMIESLLLEVNDSRNYSKLKETLSPTCLLPKGTRTSILSTDKSNEGVRIFSELVGLVLESYATNFRACLTMTEKFASNELKNIQDRMDYS